MPHSTTSPVARVDSPSSVKKPVTSTAKPRPPKKKKLTVSKHTGSGYWCKRIDKKLYYFGRICDDPGGVHALEELKELLEDLENGRERRAKVGGYSLADICNKFLDNKAVLRNQGELGIRTFEGLHATCKRMTEVLGRERPAADLIPDDFRKLRAALAEKRAAVSLRNEMQRCRSVFKFAFDERLIPIQANFGQGFDKPKLDAVRRDRENHRSKHGDRMFEATDLRRLIEASSQPLRSMILLAANCGFGQSDLSALPTRAVNLTTGWCDFARVKTSVPRRIPLWPETVASIKEWLKIRPLPADKADAGCLFLTVRGARWVKVSAPEGDKPGGVTTDGIGQEFKKVLSRLGLKRPRVGFYSIRHGFETIAGESLDQIGVDAIMGHVPKGMGANYRERISDDRLRRVVGVVRDWLFPNPSSPPSDSPKSSDTSDTSVTTPENVGDSAHPIVTLVSQESDHPSKRPVLRLFRADSIGGAA